MKHEKGVSHTAKVRAQFASDEHAVLFFTGMDLNELTDLKLDTGREWIIKYCIGQGIQEDIAEEMWKEPRLLQWWNLEWRKMDTYIVLPVLHKLQEKDRQEVYKAMHCEVFLSKHPCYTQMEYSLMRVLKPKK